MTGFVELRVRYAETDQMGVAHHANYLTWFEAARTEFLRASGKSYAEFEEQSVFLPVIEASCRYRVPARYDDLLRVECALARLTPARLELAYRVSKDRQVIAEGRTAHAFLGAERRPVNLRKRHPSLWEALLRLSGEEVTRP